MPQGSPLTQFLFVALCGFVAALAASALRRAGGGRLAALLLVVYLAVPGGLAMAGALDRYAPLPAPALLLFLCLSIGTVALAHSGVGLRIATGTGLAVLVGYQSFRVPVELLLHRLAVEGVIPEVMTYTGRNFDIVTGLAAAGIGLLLARGTAIPRGVLLAWNLLGLGLLVNIVGVAVLATPTPFRHFTEGPPNLLPGTFPYVWLPSFLVQAALFGHLALFRRLRQAG